MEYAAWPELLLELGVFRIVRIFRVFLGIQMVQIAEELIESMNGRQKSVLVAKMVLPELAGCVSERFEQLGDSRVFSLKTDRRARQPNFGEASAEHALPGDKGCSSRPCSSAHHRNQ